MYNFLADSNNELNRQLGIDTREIAEASMRDSSAMKSIAVLTMVFLPGTYLAVCPIVQVILTLVLQFCIGIICHAHV